MHLIRLLLYSYNYVIFVGLILQSLYILYTTTATCIGFYSYFKEIIYFCKKLFVVLNNFCILYFVNRKLQLPPSGSDFHQRQSVLFHYGFHTGYNIGDFIVYHVLSRMECGAGKSYDRYFILINRKCQLSYIIISFTKVRHVKTYHPFLIIKFRTIALVSIFGISFVYYKR